MTHRLLLASMGATAIAVILSPQQPSPPPAIRQLTHGDEAQDRASVWMKAKLANSKDILEGLTREDFAKIRESTDRMQITEYLEKWFRSDIEGYREQMHVFEFANSALARAAREKNVDAAALAYTQLTVSCVQCHKIVRRAK